MKLSFCIPTYNRAQYIGQTIDSIAHQVNAGAFNEDVEICISDNASTDDTAAVIFEIRKKYPTVKISYEINAENLGADKNYLRAVEIANGKYCWLFGSDDCLAPGALQRMLLEVDGGYNIILSGRYDCDIELNLLGEYNAMIGIDDCIYDFKKPGEVEYYLSKSNSIYALFSYLSSIVFDKEKWDSITYDDEMTGTAYSHAYILIAMVLNGVTLKYCRNPVVYCRLDNDSFALEGEYKRFMIDMVGYIKIANKLLPKGELRSSFLRIVRSTHPWTKLIKMNNLSPNAWVLDEKLIRSFGYGNYIFILVDMLTKFPFVVSAAVLTIRQIRRIKKWWLH